MTGEADSVVRAITEDGAFRVIAARTTETVRGAVAAQRAEGTAARHFGELITGAVLFRDKGCEHCHGVGGIGTKKGPPLTTIRTDKAWPPEKITKQILDGGKKMPPFADSLTDPEVAQIVAYLRAKHRPVPPPAPGN